MGPHIFYRVEDEDSRARYRDGYGIFAEDTKTRVCFNRYDNRLLSQVERHLDWRNRHPTPFISMYCDEEAAEREAERRVEDGKKDVRIYTIDMQESDEWREYRDVRYLAYKLGFRIPAYAWNNSEYEYIFLHYVPESAIMDCEEV
jgi:L-ribulose-5-phosphate 3-epimerase UlaE